MTWTLHLSQFSQVSVLLPNCNDDIEEVSCLGYHLCFSDRMVIGLRYLQHTCAECHGKDSLSFHTYVNAEDIRLLSSIAFSFVTIELIGAEREEDDQKMLRNISCNTRTFYKSKWWYQQRSLYEYSRGPPDLPSLLINDIITWLPLQQFFFQTFPHFRALLHVHYQGSHYYCLKHSRSTSMLKLLRCELFSMAKSCSRLDLQCVPMDRSFWQKFRI